MNDEQELGQTKAKRSCSGEVHIDSSISFMQLKGNTLDLESVRIKQ